MSYLETFLSVCLSKIQHGILEIENKHNLILCTVSSDSANTFIWKHICFLQWVFPGVKASHWKA